MRFFQDIYCPPPILTDEIPITQEIAEFIATSRKDVTRILMGTDPRLLVIIEPADCKDEESTEEIGNQCKILSDKVKDTLIPIILFSGLSLTDKNKTKFFNDNKFQSRNEMIDRIKRTRRAFLNLARKEIPAGFLFVNPLNSLYFNDVLSWVCVDGNTITSPLHQEMVSSSNIPTGFKNTPSGNYQLAISALISADSPKKFYYINREGYVNEVSSDGNPFAHLILSRNWKSENQLREIVQDAGQELHQFGLYPRVLIDCFVSDVANNVGAEMSNFKLLMNEVMSGNNLICGGVVRCNFQTTPPNLPSSHTANINAPLIDWQTTESIMMEAHEILIKSSNKRSGEISYHFINKYPFRKPGKITLEEKVNLFEEIVGESNLSKNNSPWISDALMAIIKLYGEMTIDYNLENFYKFDPSLDSSKKPEYSKNIQKMGNLKTSFEKTLQELRKLEVFLLSIQDNNLHERKEFENLIPPPLLNIIVDRFEFSAFIKYLLRSSRKSSNNTLYYDGHFFAYFNLPLNISQKIINRAEDILHASEVKNK